MKPTYTVYHVLTPITIENRMKTEPPENVPVMEFCTLKPPGTSVYDQVVAGIIADMEERQRWFLPL